MFNLTNADKLRKRMQEKEPDYEKRFMDRMRKDQPDKYAKYIHEDVYGHHIGDRETYNDFVKDLPWKDGTGYGEKWKVDEIENRSKINFNDYDFDKYDYAYEVNRMYADNNNALTDFDAYLKVAKNHLTDNYYNGIPAERAYEEAKTRMKRYYNSRRDRDNDGRYNE